MFSNLEFHRGDKVRNRIEGWEGTVVSAYICGDAMPMIGVAIPKKADKAEYEGETINVTVDMVDLVLVKRDMTDGYNQAFPSTNKYKIGDAVINIFEPDYSGTIIGVRCHCNFCYGYMVATHTKDRDNKSNKFQFAESNLRLDESKPNVFTAATKQTSTETTRPGGPSFITESRYN